MAAARPVDTATAGVENGRMHPPLPLLPPLRLSGSWQAAPGKCLCAPPLARPRARRPSPPHARQGGPRLLQAATAWRAHEGSGVVSEWRPVTLAGVVRAATPPAQVAPPLVPRLPPNRHCLRHGGQWAGATATVATDAAVSAVARRQAAAAAAALTDIVRTVDT